jgi:hypothetical protein
MAQKERSRSEPRPGWPHSQGSIYPIRLSQDVIVGTDCHAVGDIQPHEYTMQ